MQSIIFIDFYCLKIQKKMKKNYHLPFKMINLKIFLINLFSFNLYK